MFNKKKEIKKAIELAWDNPQGKDLRDKLFPNGKPSTDEFIRVVSEYAKTKLKENVV